MITRVILLSFLSGLALALATTALGESDAAPRESSLAWLALIDSSEYSKSWQMASTAFQTGVSLQSWVEQVQSARRPLGRLKYRQEVRLVETTDPPDAPAGLYVVVTYSSDFEHRVSVTETHSLVHDANGTWRTIGYFIK